MVAVYRRATHKSYIEINVLYWIICTVTLQHVRMAEGGTQFLKVLVQVKASWNVMAHAQRPDFVFRQDGRVHLNGQGRQFSRLLSAKVCASAVVTVVMLDTPCSEVVRRVLATYSIRQFPLHFPSCAITFQVDSTTLHAIYILKLSLYFFNTN
jgi:hypothetical protein